MNSDTTARLTTALADRYRIERELGQGGMATVYLAHDLRHDRPVAVKVLRPELAAVIGAERFLSEIKTTAHLQHPHILPLHDSGEARDAGDPMGRPYLYYVMPFIEGESLRDRLNREKQLPITDAVRIASEIASALDYAHRHGVIHRDIKPENILLHDGRALVADFGIALAASKAGGSRMTETGMSLGTPHYMSPEQAMGEREITARSDVYALGCVTYEMLVGEPPFTGPTAQAIVAKVMTTDPVPPSVHRKTIPPHVEDAVLVALAKLPADRFASAAEFASALAAPGSVSQRHPTVATGRLAHSPGPGRRAVWLAGLVALGAAIAAFLAGQRRGRLLAPPLPPSRLGISAPTLGGSGGSALSRQLGITPTGDAVVYVGLNALGNNALYFQRLDALEPVEIPGSTALRGPSISLDGRWIIGTTLVAAARLPLSGGAAQQLPAPLGTAAAGAWDAEGSYWFTEANVAGIGRLTANDSVIPLRRETSRGLRVQQVLDDGRTALVIQAPAGTPSGPGLLFDLASADLTPLVNGPVVEMRAVAGELICVLPDGSITSTAFDPGTRRVTGQPVQVATGVSLSGTGVAQFAVANNGTVAYIPEAPRSLVLLDRSGAARQATEQRPNLHAPKFSPDGRRLSFDITTGEGRDVWILSLDQHTLSRATFDRDGHDATWSRDGRFINYISFRSGALGIYRTRPGSTTPAESLIASNHLTYSGAWLLGGDALLTSGNDVQGTSNADIVLVRNGGRGPIEPLVASPFQEGYPALSPDSRWLAFVSDQSGRQEVYVQSLSGEGEQVQVSQDGGTEPVWGPDGREIFYRSTKEGELELMVATVHIAPGFTVIGRRPLFPISDMVATAPHANYDISPDGRTFAMVRRSPATRIIIIQNLPELVRRLRGSDAGRS